MFPVNDNHLHLAFVIPGILYPEKSPSQLEHEQLTQTFAINTIGPMLIAKHFLPFLPRKVRLLNYIPSQLVIMLQRQLLSSSHKCQS
jgi:hypothetical protein